MRLFDAEERSDVVVIDIPVVYLHAESDECFAIIIEGQMTEMVVIIDPKVHTRHVIIKNVTKVIYVRLKKALHG